MSRVMRYIFALNGFVIAFIVFVFAVIFIPGKGPSDDIELVLTISTFLFAILAGFFISRLNSRYNKIYEALASEDAYLLSIYKTANLCGKDVAKRFAQIMDRYFIEALDFEIGEYYKSNTKEFLMLYDETHKIKSKFDIYKSKILGLLHDIENLRNLTSSLSREKVTYGQWSILILLAGLLLFCMFYLKTNVLSSQITTVLLSSVLVLVLLTLRDLQNLRVSGEIIMGESAQEVLEVMGKPRYYHQNFLKDKSVKLPKYVKKYRVGLHQPGKTPKFKIVTR